MSAADEQPVTYKVLQGVMAGVGRELRNCMDEREAVLQAKIEALETDLRTLRAQVDSE